MVNFYILIGVLALVIYLTIKGRNNNYFISENNSNMSVGFSYGRKDPRFDICVIVGFGGLSGWLGYSVFTLLFGSFTINIFRDTIHRTTYLSSEPETQTKNIHRTSVQTLPESYVG